MYLSPVDVGLYVSNVETESPLSECRKRTQRSVSKLSYTTQHTHTKKMPKIAMHTKNRIDSTVCIVFFACMHCIFWFLIALQAMRPLRCVCYNNLKNRM